MHAKNNNTIQEKLFEDIDQEIPINSDLFFSFDPPLLVPAYGVGRDSTAMIIEMKNRDIRPDLILFADPGSEKPESYKYLSIMNEWLRSVGFPEITVVRKASPRTGDTSLEMESLRKGLLPSIAYGGHSCSDKWKAAPQEKCLNNWPPARLSWRRKKKVVRAIGYEAAECGRIKKAVTYLKKRPDKKFDYWYPLQEWNMSLPECVATIEKEGLPIPMKSSCTFCPSSKLHEIEWLAENHPDLFLRALVIEETASINNRSVKGLGRSFAWRDLPCAKPFLVQLHHRKVA